LKVYLIFNAQGREPTNQNMSGGAIRQMEILKRLGKKPTVVLWVTSSKTLCDTFQENNIKAFYNITPYFIKGDSLAETLLDSIFRSVYVSITFLLPKRGNVLIYSPSDFLWDTLPALIWKLRCRKAKWVVCIFLVVPHLFRDYSKTFAKNNRFSLPTFRRLFYFLSQQLTILLGKRWADQILVLNKTDKEYMLETIGVDGSKVSVVSGGVDYSHIKKLKTQVNLYDGIFLGRFHPQKGIFDLIKIWKLVCNKKPEARLCMIGRGLPSFEEKIKALIRENNLGENIELVGLKQNDEKFLLMKSSSMFLCPSHYESFAIVIAEAMACGLPVIAYNLPIFNDIYGENILKVPLGDTSKFADAVINFLNDDELRRSFGLKGQKFIQKYDWDEIAEKEYQLIIKLLDEA
jgi:glycosyltransferase involved in cell wall biosynthesis